MTELSLDRFRALADAYGGVVQRWPEAEREAAARFARIDPTARAVLDEALALDEALDAWTVTAPAPALSDRLLAAAPRPRSRPGRLRLWWSGVGLAAALAGAAAGSVAAAAVAPPDLPGDASTAFGDPGGQEI